MLKIPQMPDASGESLRYTEVQRYWDPVDPNSLAWIARSRQKSGTMRILLADERPKTRFALRALLRQQAGLAVVGEAAHATELLALVEETSPDVVLLGWGLRGLPAAELLPALRRVSPSAYLIALSSRPEVRQTALAAGADAFVSKIDPPGRLLLAITDGEGVGRHSQE